MHNRTASALLLTALLAGCNSQPSVDVKNATGAEVQKELDAAGGAEKFVNPGRWEMKQTIEEMSMPGMPPEVAAQMKSRTGAVPAAVVCLTPEQAKRPNADFLAGTHGDCRYDHYTMSGGKISAAMKCKAPGGGAMTMEMAGTYTGDAYSMAVTMVTATARGSMKMRSRMDAKRLGACDGTEMKS